MATRRLAITKRVSLAEVSEGWEDSCYAVVTLATNREQFAITETDTSKLNNRESIELQAKFVREHFVRGEVLALDEDGEPSLVPMAPEDIEDNTEIANRLFLACVGADTDPKDTPPAASDGAEQPNSEATTKTSLSTD